MNELCNNLLGELENKCSMQAAALQAAGNSQILIQPLTRKLDFLLSTCRATLHRELTIPLVLYSYWTLYLVQHQRHT